MNDTNYLYEDLETGEYFIVEAIDEDTAKEIAEKYFEDPCCLDILSDEEAENLGYDTYTD